MTQGNAENQDPFAATTVPSDDDPFSSPDEFGGGGERGPSLNEMFGRVVIFQPTGLLKDRPARDEQGNPLTKDGVPVLQDVAVADITILGPEPISFRVKAKDGTFKMRTVATPYTFVNQWVYGKGMLIKLEGTRAKNRPLLGTVRRCPDGAGYAKKLTPDDIDQRWANFIANPGSVSKPVFSWGVVMVPPGSPEHVRALAWYRGQQ